MSSCCAYKQTTNLLTKCIQAFTRQTLAAYTPTVVSVVESYVARWVQAGRVRGYTEGKIMALDVAGAVLMGWRFDRQELEEFR